MEGTEMILQQLLKKSRFFFEFSADLSFSFYPKYFSRGTVL